MQANRLEGIMKKHVTNGMEAKNNGCPLSNLMLHDICSGDNESSSIILEYEFPHIEDNKSVISAFSSKKPLVQYESNHKIFEEGMNYLRCQG